MGGCLGVGVSLVESVHLWCEQECVSVRACQEQSERKALKCVFFQDSVS